MVLLFKIFIKCYRYITENVIDIEPNPIILKNFIFTFSTFLTPNHFL